MGDSDQKAVLVTDVDSNLGKAVVFHYAKLGYKISLVSATRNRLEMIVNSLKIEFPDRTPDNFLALHVNPKDLTKIDLIIDQTVKEFARLDILINIVSYMGRRLTLRDADFFEDFQNVLQVNLMATTLISQLAMSHLVKCKGVIINVLSMEPHEGIPYNVSKAGMKMLTKTLANAVIGSEVRVINVNPYRLETERSSNDDFLVCNYKDITDTIVFLSSNKASYIHGCTIDVGYSTKITRAPL